MAVSRLALKPTYFDTLDILLLASRPKTFHNFEFIR